jgi:hypothetical protein
MQPGSFIEILDPIGTLQHTIQQMLDMGIGEFDRIGQDLVLIVLTCYVVIFMVRVQLGCATFGAGTPLLDVVTAIMTGVVSWTVVRYYRTPIPGVGYSVVGLIDAEFHSWMLLFGRTTVAQVYKNLETLWGVFMAPTGGLFSLLPNLLYWAGLVFVTIAKALVLYATTYGLIGAAITRLFGAPLLAFALVPRLSQLAWNWLWMYLNYSLRPVVGMAYLFVMNGFLARAVSIIPREALGAGIGTYGAQVILVLLVFIGGIKLVSEIPSGFFGGPAGTVGFNPLR